MKLPENKTVFVAAGLMSGTSMDGIDSALLITDGERQIEHLGNYSLQYEPKFRVALKKCERAVWESKGNLDKAKEALEFDQIITRSTDLHAQAIQGLLKITGHKAADVDIIGYHGQTLFHCPDAHLTIQAGDGQRLADQTGIAVVYDFRSNDIKHGGQGAPLAPLYHQALAIKNSLVPVVVANCGGIANVTIIGAKPEDLCAYDCGPGNTLIDRFVQFKIGQNMDKDGLFGSKGSVNKSILQTLQRKAIILKNGENYLDKKSPKSLDVNDITLIAEAQALSLEDGCATLEAFTAQCIVESLDTLSVPVPNTWVLAGGGWKNKVINRELEVRLRQKLGSDIHIQHADQLDWSSQYMEAQVFAYLAVRSLRKMPLSLPSTTGVSEPLTGGRFAAPTNV